MTIKQQSLATKHLNLTITRHEEMAPIMKALGSPLRLAILRTLMSRPMHVHEIAQALDIPVSTAALNIRELEDSGLLITDQQPGARGVMKLCSRRLDSLMVNLIPSTTPLESVQTFSLPIGCYSFAEDIEPTCGLASAEEPIGEYDNPRSFYVPERFGAQLLWLRQGYITYHFALLRAYEMDIKRIEISCELCSEAPCSCDPWKSDIDMSINGTPIGTYVSPADFGGRRGLVTHPWWDDVSTQFGMLRTWSVTQHGSFIDSAQVSDVKIADLRLNELPFAAVRIGVSKDAVNVGGMNLFGRGFDDFPQDLVMRVFYSAI
jgi:predicted transcriptional regulator